MTPYPYGRELAVASCIDLCTLPEQLLSRPFGDDHHGMTLLLDSLHEEGETALLALQLDGQLGDQTEVHVSRSQRGVHYPR